MAGSSEGIAVALLNFCRLFKWWHVTLLIDSSAKTDFYATMDQSLKLLAMSEGYLQFQLDGFSFDSSSIQSTVKALKLATRRSRGRKPLKAIFFPKTKRNFQNSFFSIMFLKLMQKSFIF
jgi:hypothetical protein